MGALAISRGNARDVMLSSQDLQSFDLLYFVNEQCIYTQLLKIDHAVFAMAGFNFLNPQADFLTSSF
jgi:hypothetical protein